MIAYTLPAASALRFAWAVAALIPVVTVSGEDQPVTGSDPFGWTEKYAEDASPATPCLSVQYSPTLFSKEMIEAVFPWSSWPSTAPANRVGTGHVTPSL